MTHNIEKRTCANCCALVDGACINLVDGPVNQSSNCELHETEAEFSADVQALARFRVAIGLPPQIGAA